MKKLFNVLMITLALNFIAVAGAAGWLYQKGHLNREAVMKIKEVLFPPPAPEPVLEEEKPDATTQPVLRLEELLARQTSHSAAEQVEFIQQTFDSQMAQLDLRHRELRNLENQVDLAKQKVAADRAALEAERQTLVAEQQQTTTLATDKGFQDSLTLYSKMSSKQVKEIFMKLDDDTVTRYLQTMEPRIATKIMKEFKADDELERIHSIMEKMRQAEVSVN